MEELRRGQLIEATIASIHEDGFAATTLQRIGRRAGLSPGLVAHYFSDKTGLIEATMLRIANELHAATPNINALLADLHAEVHAALLSRVRGPAAR